MAYGDMRVDVKQGTWQTSQPKIVGYRVEHADSASGLEEEVMRYLRCGWQLHGGVAISNMIQDGDTTSCWYAQVLVKYEDPPCWDTVPRTAFIDDVKQP